MAGTKPRNSTARKDAILAKAALLFRKKGFKAASLREIAGAVGIEAPSLYNHIGSKQEILKEICFAVADNFTEHMNSVSVAKITAEEKVKSLIRFHINQTDSDFDRIFTANHEWKHLATADARVFVSRRRHYEAAMQKIIMQGVKAGEFRKAEPQIVVLTILSALRGLEYLQRKAGKKDRALVEQTMVQQLTGGILN